LKSYVPKETFGFRFHSTGSVTFLKLITSAVTRWVPADWHYHLVFKDRPHCGGKGFILNRGTCVKPCSQNRPLFFPHRSLLPWRAAGRPELPRCVAPG